MLILCYSLLLHVCVVRACARMCMNVHVRASDWSSMYARVYVKRVDHMNAGRSVAHRLGDTS